MSFQLPVKKQSDQVGQGFERAKPGGYHVMVKTFKEYESTKGSHVVELEIVAAPKDLQDQLAMIHTEFFSSQASDANPDSTWWAERIQTLLVATGAATNEYFDECFQKGVDAEIDLQSCVGRQMFVELIEEEDHKKQMQTRIGNRGFAMFHVSDPAAKHFPRNAGLLKRAGVQEASDESANDDDNLSGLL